MGDDLATNVHVNLGDRSYDIAIGPGLIHETGPFALARGAMSQAVIITDANVHTPHAQAVATSLSDLGVDVDILIVPPGEESKSLATAAELWQQVLESGADRKSWIVAVGGGVVGDLAGFIAATFTRGLRFLQVPTTLLADVDSSVGGKVGVNLPTAKNMVGAFWQPTGVVIDTDALSTLPEREYRSGLAEVVKYGVILDAPFFEYLEGHVDGLNDRDAEVLRYTIARCCRLKADVVEKDEREETGLRAVLNYGHTFAHAFEAVGGYGELLHGEAVSIGMQCAARLAARLGKVDNKFVNRQSDLLRSLRLPIEVPNLNEQDLLAAMQRDKKVAHGRLRFVLPSRLGQVELAGNIAAQDVLLALKG